MSDPSLEEVLRALAKSNRLSQLMIMPSKGEWQASFRDGESTGYRIVSKKDPVEALMGALGPRFGDTWEQHLSNPSKPLKAPKTRDVKKREKMREEQPFDDDIEDLL